MVFFLRNRWIVLISILPSCQLKSGESHQRWPSCQSPTWLVGRVSYMPVPPPLQLHQWAPFISVRLVCIRSQRIQQFIYYQAPYQRLANADLRCSTIGSNFNYLFAPVVVSTGRIMDDITPNFAIRIFSWITQ